jgi:hypothetical protein
MRLEQIGNKKAHILHVDNGDGRSVWRYELFSYETPVACYDVPNGSLLSLDKDGINQWLRAHGRPELTKTPTTTRHINLFRMWLADNGYRVLSDRKTSSYEDI